MAIIKCKMCGGDIAVNEEKTFGTCEYCGSTMTLPKVGDEQRAALFNRGNHFRRSGEFDKALAIYENILREDDGDAEAHWCCALCRFGIEYVEDPNTLEYIPTCHRASFDSFLEDIDYLTALENSDGITHRQYQKDAQKIAEVQRGILATSQNEEPFDVFICYKETDDTTKQRTKDSIDAQEIYYQLTNEGYRVFFSRITLEDKTGAEYEPYIFAALNSAKVMIVIGSKQEYFNAVWVKNEWSRFLALMRRDRTKILLPCFKGIDPYDLPEQLSVLQSYDMSKIGFIQDLIRGIKKIVEEEGKKAPVKEKIVPVGNMNIAPLLERAFLFLEDGKWQEANTYCEKVLDNDPKNAEAYLGKLMAELYVRRRGQLANCAESFEDRENYKKILRFGDVRIKSEICDYIEHINNNHCFIDAVMGNDTEKAISYLEKGADVDCFSTGHGDKTPVLISAIANNNGKLVEVLLSKGANSNGEYESEHRRFSALAEAISNEMIAKMLIAAGADVNYISVEKNNKTPVLILAIKEGKESLVKYLIDKGANPNCERVFKDGNRYSALRDAIIEWPNDSIASMLIAAGADVNYIGINDKLKCPVLISAIVRKNEKIVELMLSKGANPNCERVFKDGRRFSALRDAKKTWPNKIIAKMLKKHGAKDKITVYN